MKVVPLKICTRPTTMIRHKAISFPTVKTSWILVAIRTLEQFTQVSNTERQSEARKLVFITSKIIYNLTFFFYMFES